MSAGKKVAFLIVLVFAYLIAAVALQQLVGLGILKKAPRTEIVKDAPDTLFEEDIEFNLEAAKNFFEGKFVKESGHIDLYIQDTIGDNQTNSEAISYYLLWKAIDKDKESFDKELDYVESKVLEPTKGYMMWRLDADDNVQGDGMNIASDADLRTIKALFIAEKEWKDERYAVFIDKLARGLEATAITEDVFLAPYGGATGQNSSWVAEQIWLSYADFSVFEELGKRKGGIWSTLNSNMKQAVLNAQIHNGLYNSMLTEKREYGNGIDNGGYSINSLWIMVRCAESSDLELRESARRSLQFYKDKYEKDGFLSQSYDSSGNALIADPSPWVYALVGRAAVHLQDFKFAKAMMEKLVEYQSISDEKVLGAIFEGSVSGNRVGQFTMQESILTMQQYVAHKPLMNVRSWNESTIEGN